MPLAGGESDKVGNRYEALWTVDRLLDVLDGEYDSIRLEPPAPHDRGFEFLLRRGTVLEFHQVKRQHASRGHWSLGDLAQSGVLENFWRKLLDSNARCLFVSTQDALELKELADRARSAASFGEFCSCFLTSNSLKTNLGQLREYWHGQPEEAIYERLRRIVVESVSERYLRKSIENRLALFAGSSRENMSDVLFAFVFANVHKELAPNDVRQHLRQRGFVPPLLASGSDLWMKVHEQNQRYASQIRRVAIRGKMICRPEARQTIDYLDRPDGPRAIMLIGGAGDGKSSVLLQIVENLEARGTPLLAFRADRLVPTNLPRDVGRQLDLPDSPARVLAAVSHGKPSVLVIDQLDAVSKASGRNASFFDCLLEIVEQTSSFRNIRLVLACRKFDSENDDRLRQLTSQQGIAVEQTISGFRPELVKEVVASLGLDAGRLTEQQLRLLKSPLHLSLLSQVAQSASATALDFTTLNDLYGRFWDEKQKQIAERRGAPIRWQLTMDRICEQMSTGQRLVVPLSGLDDYRADVDAMASENVLVTEQRQCAFFHESLFDYAFARRFAAKTQTLVEFLCSDSQELFRRSQVRQILQYLREEDPQRYLNELEAFIDSAEVRFHLHWIALAWLSTLTELTAKELQVIATLMQKQGEYAIGYRRLLIDFGRRSAVWFLLAHGNGALTSWLGDSREEVVNTAVDILATCMPSQPAATVELLEPFLRAPDPWMLRVKWVLGRAELAVDRPAFELWLAVIEEGGFDRRDFTFRQDDFWIHLYRLASKNADRAARALGCMLRRSIHVSTSAGEANPLKSSAGAMPQCSYGDTVIDRIAQSEPKSFVEWTLEPLLQIIAANADPVAPGTGFRRDEVFRWRQYRDAHDLPAKILRAMEDALRSIAANQPDIFRSMIPVLKRGDLETPHLLLMRAYAANGAEFADETAGYLSSDIALLSIGYRGDNYAAVDLVRSIAPYCSVQRLAVLERILMSHYPAWERSATGHQEFGREQFRLLSAIPPERRSGAARARLMELEHKFGPARISEPARIKGGVVPSPIPRRALEKMTDDQWLRALDEYKAERWGSRKRGGPLQVSQDLGARTKADPERFANLLRRFPPAVHPSYISAVLYALADSKARPEIVVGACEYVHGLPGHPAGRGVCYCIQRYAESELPESTCALVAWYATEDPDPKDVNSEPEIEGISTKSLPDLVTVGLNTVRGGAAHAMANLIHARPDRTDWFRVAVERMVHDPSTAVRAMVASVLIAVLRHDRNYAVRQFLRLCDADDELLGAGDVEEFMHYSLRTHFSTLEPILMRMLRAPDKTTSVAGARQSCLAALMIEEAQPLLNLCLEGSEDLRLGAAQMAAANIVQANLTGICKSILMRLFNDDSVEVRKEASGCFRNFAGSSLEEAKDLAVFFVNSIAFRENYDEILRCLDESTSALPEVTLLACAKFIELVGEEASNISHRAAASAGEAGRLIVRVYGTSTDVSFRGRCLDVIDRMLAFQTMELPEALEAYER